MAFTYNNFIHVTANTAASINSDLASMNAADFLVSAITFDGAGNAFLLFTENAGSDFVVTQPQKVNEVGSTQGAIDTDTASEAEDGWVPTGVFADPTTDQFFILYQLLNEAPAP